MNLWTCSVLVGNLHPSHSFPTIRGWNANFWHSGGVSCFCNVFFSEPCFFFFFFLWWLKWWLCHKARFLSFECVVRVNIGYLSILFCFCFFHLKVEENNTQDKSKDNVPLDSQSECTNYFLQYISTPRWLKIYAFIVLAACFHLWLISFIVFFFSFPHVPLVQKMPQTVQTAGQNLFLGRTCPSEFWWVNAALVVHFRFATHCWSYEQVLKLDLFFPPRVRQRPSHRVKKIKKFYLLLLQNHRHRKPPQRRVMTQIWRSKTGSFKTDCFYYTHSIMFTSRKHC